MSELRAFDRRLRQLANLERADEPRIQIEGSTGGAGVGGPGLRISHTPQERQQRIMLRDLDKLKLAGEVEAGVQEALIRFLKDRHSILARTPSIWPTRGKGAEKTRWITSGYGRRRSPFTGKVQFHAGIDIAAPIGTPIVSPADGVITYTGYGSGYGRLLEIDHGNGLVTRYGHLHRIKVKEGQEVKRWDVIASVGNSGRAIGSHLHYEVHMGGVPTNPKYYILD
jgi:Membrane proteins related to metalloendopeptidases